MKMLEAIMENDLQSLEDIEYEYAMVVNYYRYDEDERAKTLINILKFNTTMNDAIHEGKIKIETYDCKQLFSPAKILVFVA